MAKNISTTLGLIAVFLSFIALSCLWEILGAPAYLRQILSILFILPIIRLFMYLEKDVKKDD